MNFKHYVKPRAALAIFTLTTAIAATATLSNIASAETAQEAAVKKLVEPRLRPGTKIDSVTKTPYLGLYEVRVGTEIMYTDDKARYLFLGEVIDAVNHTNYTKAKIDEVSRVKFTDLPLDNAIKMVRGNGKRMVAVFEDPNCGYCKHLRKTLQGMDNLTVYTFMYNILSDDSALKSRNIWCAPDRSKAWDDWMLNGKQAPTAAASCTDPNKAVFEFGRKLAISATPTIFFADGSRVPGAIEAPALEEKLNRVK